MGSDLTLYKVVLYGNHTVSSEKNIFPSSYNPYIEYEEMLDLSSLWERIGEGMCFPITIDAEECNDCPVTTSIIDCGKCPLGLKLDYMMRAERGNEYIDVHISHAVVEQFMSKEPFWTVKVKRLFYRGVGYYKNTFLEGKSPFVLEYPRIYHTPKELDVFKNNLVRDDHKERIESVQKEFKKALEKDPNVFVWGSY
jgi:hypothetical protein